MDTQRNNIRWLLLYTIVILPTAGFNIYDKVTCNLPTLKQELDKCTTHDEQPVYIFLPPSLASTSTSEVGMQTFVSSTGVDYQQVFLQVDYYKCQKEQRVKRESQVDCRYNRMMVCVPYGYRSYLPDKTRIKEGMRYLCDHLFSLKQGCEMGKLSQLNQCVKDKDQGSYNEDEDFTEEDAMCRTYEYARDCMQSSLGQCGQADIDLHLKVMDYLRPQFCGASAHVASLSAILFITGLLHVASKMLFHM